MKKLLFFVGVRLVLALILAAVVVVFRWEYFQTGAFTVRFMNTPVYWVIHVMMALLVISALVKPLRELYRSRTMPYQEPIERFVLELKTAFSRLSVQFVFWGIIVFVVVSALWQLGPLRDNDFRFNQMGFPWRNTPSAESEVRLFYLFTRDNNHDRYLESCLKIARDLKEVGARAVFIPLPYFLQSDNATETIRKIHETGIAVFGVINFWDNSLLEAVTPAGDLRAGLLTIDRDQNQSHHFSFVRDVTFSPKGRGTYRGVAHDALFEILGQYHGVPSDELVWTGSEVVVGVNRYPATEDGRVFVGRIGRWAKFWSPITGGYGMNWFGQKGIRPSGDKDSPARFEYVDAASLSRKTPETNLRNHRNLFHDKIVVLQWADLGPVYPTHYPWEANYAWMLDCLVRGDVPVRSDFYTTGGIMLGIFITGFILYAARPLTAITLLVLSWGVFILVPSWFFQIQAILIDAPAIFAACLASAAVFTVVRLANEWRTRPHASLVGSLEPAAVSFTAPGSSAGSAFLKKRFAVSYALATGVMVLTIVLTVLVTSSLQTDGVGEQETTYVMSYPAIEVQGDNPAETVVQ